MSEMESAHQHNSSIGEWMIGLRALYSGFSWTRTEAMLDCSSFGSVLTAYCLLFVSALPSLLRRKGGEGLVTGFRLDI